MFEERLKYLGNGYNMWENDLDKWCTAYVFKKRYKYVANDLNILNMA